MQALAGRQLKRQVLSLLQAEPFAPSLDTLCAYPARRVVNPLISFFLHAEARVRWRAVTAMGAVVSGLAEDRMESARVILRRLMWSLNDESGGIGWGAPEAMGEIMARSAPLTEEYARILVSYADPAGNYLEHEGLQRGLLWGLGRLAHARPSAARPAAPLLPAFFSSTDPYLRGTAIWAAGPIMERAMRPVIEARRSDSAPLQLYQRMHILSTTVGKLAREALAKPR